MAAYGLYTHIQANRWRSIALLIGLFVLVYVLTFAGALVAEVFLGLDDTVTGYVVRAWRDLIPAVPFVTVLTVIWVIVAYFFHQNMIDAVTGGRAVTRAAEPRLYNLLENLCISRGIPMPKLKVMESDALNAFATGLNNKQYSITVTSALLRSLNDAELEAVLGHELTHIRNGDVRLLVIAVVIAGVISFVGELVFRGLFNSSSGYSFGSGRSSSSNSSSGDKKGGGAGLVILIALALIAIAWVLSIVIRFALSRSRELLADAGSVELTKNPDAMISALRKIEGRGELKTAPSAVMEMCIDNPREEFADLFATHPSVNSRVAALIRFAGGHDPGPLALPTAEANSEAATGADADAPAGPWSNADHAAEHPAGVPLPGLPPVLTGGTMPRSSGPAPTHPPGTRAGPWDSQRG